MRLIPELARMGILYCLAVMPIGAYNSYVWMERAYDVKLQPVDEACSLEARTNELQAELYFARSKLGSNQLFSHMMMAVLFAIIARTKPGGSDGKNAP